MNELSWAEDEQKLLFSQEIEQFLKKPFFNKNAWQIKGDLGVEVPKHLYLQKLNFEHLSQEWLRLLAKLYILVKAKFFSSSSLIGHLSTLNKFSLFLRETSLYSPDQIDNQVFEDFDYYLHSQGLSKQTISLKHIHLANFFNTCRLEKWLDVNTYWFQGKRIRRKYENHEIKYIPEEVWSQLQDNLYLLPEQLQRMVLIIRTMGLRVGELLNLPFNCLRKRKEQWRLRLQVTEKYQVEDELPIVPPELVIIIQEQQNYIKQFFGNRYSQLFCSNKSKAMKKNETWEFKRVIPQVMKSATFNRWLNSLAQKADIRTKDGNLWHFTSHQFRRTVATIMTNAGIRDLIIQKYLRHRSPDMQRYYKHLLKQVLKDEYQELIKEKKYVDITGKIVDSHQHKNPITEFLRRRMYQITTQYGECHRSTLKDPCPTVNACWRCKDWRVSSEDLPYLKKDLQRVEDELKITQENGMLRQQQGLEDDRNSLLNCLRALEKNNDQEN